MVAIAAALVDHVPPVVASVIVIDAPAQIEVAPPNVAGGVGTVIIVNVAVL